MAVKNLEEVLAALSGDERKLFDSTLSKNPELRDGWLRQDDYSRKLNEFKAKETEFEAAQADKERWEAWAERNVPIWDSLAEKGIVDKDTGEELWTKTKTDLETQLEEARKAAVAGADMDPAELDKRVREITKEAGVLSRTELDAVIQAEAKKLATETFDEQWKAKESDFNTKTIPFVAGFSGSYALAAMQYQQETGEKWTAEKRDEFYKLMATENNFDPEKVLDKFMTPFRDKKLRQEEIQTEAKKLAATMSGMPGSGSGDQNYIPPSEAQKGAMRQMLERSAEGDGDFESLIMNKAREAGAALRAEGKT